MANEVPTNIPAVAPGMSLEDIAKLKALNVKLANSELRKQITQDLRQEDANVERVIQSVRDKNPTIPKEVFNDIVELRAKYLQNYIENVKEIDQIQPQGAQIDKDWREKEKNAAQTRRDDYVVSEAKLRNRARTTGREDIAKDADIDNAIIAINKELPDDKGVIGTVKGFGKSIISSIYDEDKGGLQKGGIIGLVVGLVGGSMLTGGMGGGAMGIISTILIAVAAVWAGNKIMDSSPAPTHAAAPAAAANALSRGVSQAQDAAAVHNAEAKKAEAQRAEAQRAATAAGVQPLPSANATHATVPAPSPAATAPGASATLLSQQAQGR